MTDQEAISRAREHLYDALRDAGCETHESPSAARRFAIRYVTNAIEGLDELMRQLAGGQTENGK